jgi:hypothetical protein
MPWFDFFWYDENRTKDNELSTVPSRGPMPADLQERWQQALRAIDPAQIEGDFAACEFAARESSFSGFVRRAVHSAGLPLTLIAERAEIESKRLTEFLRGRGTPESLELDRLLVTLGIELIGTQAQQID